MKSVTNLDKIHPSRVPAAVSALATTATDTDSSGAGELQRVRTIWGAARHETPRPTVSVVVPALNEERNLPYIAARMPRDVDEIVFVNGDSVDQTAQVARQLWPDAVHVRQTRRGKGNALACGIAAASGDIIVMIDADGSTDPLDIPRYVGALVSGVDYAKGSRFIQGGGSADITKFRQLGNRVLNGLVNILFSTRYTDLCYGYNAFWRRCVGEMRLPDVDAVDSQWGDGFEIETLVNVRVAAAGLNIVEVCSYESSRIHGLSNLRAVPDGTRVLRTILREYRYARDAKKRPPSAGGPPVEGIGSPRPTAAAEAV
jgi:glycosyltransferase involved in cell wall biosynthesis